MSDLVEGLRKGVWGRARRADAAIQTLMQDGADRIEAQAARIAELEAALRGLMPTALHYGGLRDCDLAAIKEARAALEGEKKDG